MTADKKGRLSVPGIEKLVPRARGRTMSGIAFFVELDIDPAQRDPFDAYMLDHSSATLNGEEGWPGLRRVRGSEEPQQVRVVRTVCR